MNLKKAITLSILCGAAITGFAQNNPTEIIDGVKVVTATYGMKLSRNGNIIVGETAYGGTVYYNREQDQIYYYAEADYGRGYVAADNGWVVGCMMLDYESTRAVIMADGRVFTPDCFDRNVAGNIHSITPDASRICGVVGNNGPGPSYFPFYCDIDENGNFGELQYLPTPKKDFFNAAPQYCSATWISSDGKTIAGQVIQSRGLYVYPIIYQQNDEGVWSYFCPSEKLFNPNNLPIPNPVGDIDDEFPDAPYPEITDFMSPLMVPKWNDALDIWNANNFAEELDPYAHLNDFMTDEQIAAYKEAEAKYNEAFEKYNEMNEKYWDEMFRIGDESVFFVRNAMALSADGKWLASSAQIEDLSDPYDPRAYYVPYLFNLETGEIRCISNSKRNLLTNQVLPGGTVIMANPASEVASSYIYDYKKDQMISLFDYLGNINPKYSEWFVKNTSADEVVVGEDEDGNLIYRTDLLVTGVAEMSDDGTVVTGGIDGYVLDYGMYFTYIFDDLPAGVEEVKVDNSFDGVYRVFNLQGLNVLTTKNPEEINTLAKGIYIINGKKVAIK